MAASYSVSKRKSLRRRRWHGSRANPDCTAAFLRFICPGATINVADQCPTSKWIISASAAIKTSY